MRKSILAALLFLLISPGVLSAKSFSDPSSPRISPASRQSSPKVSLSREQLIKKQLDCFENPQTKEFGWNDVCYADYSAQEREKVIDGALDEAATFQQNSNADSNSEIHYEQPLFVDSAPDADQIQGINESFDFEQSDALSSNSDQANLGEQSSPGMTSDIKIQRHKVELGSEVFSYHYKEPDLTVDIKGVMAGFYGLYEFRPDKGSQIIDEVINMYKLDARFSYGLVDYQSDPSGTSDDIDDYVVEFRGMAGYDFLITPRDRITPYAGLGFRYLYDGGGGTTTSTGDLGYDRVSHYFYAPIGVDFLKQLSADWQMGANLEAEVLLWGRQDSYLSDASSSYGDLKNEQKRGFGLRGSFKFVRKSHIVDFLFEPFIRYWRIKNSEVDSAVGPTGVTVTGYEPDNNTTEFGLKLGVQY